MDTQEAPPSGKYVLNIAEWARLHLKDNPRTTRRHYVVKWTLDDILAACGGLTRSWWKEQRKRGRVDVKDVRSLCRFILSQWSRREERRLRREKRRKLSQGG